MSSNVLISLIIPAYNEERRLPESLKDMLAFLPPLGVPFEVLVMVEKSTDQTIEKSRAVVAHDPRFQIVDNKVQRGKGYAVRSGMLRAQGEFVFYMDADLSTPLAEIVHFMGHFSQYPDVDVLVGSRDHAKSQVIKRQRWLRQNMGRIFNRFVQILGVPGITDTQCGFKAFRRNANHAIFSRTTIDGFAFDVEVLILAKSMGFKMDVLPVRWINSPDSKVRILIDPLKMLWDLLKIRRRVHQTLKAQPLSSSTSLPQ